ncbi:MAG: hypothetical protein A2286_06060 [Gammaproteobacteria bacterium RIFOXYA12_FULL_61_12]|nr:MAG: hypothetical protein A2286_06060 [Gammaproteobacteria bacterium RIFOXYA12_FULL_61_12]
MLSAATLVTMWMGIVVEDADRIEYFRLHKWRDRWHRLLRSGRYELQSDVDRIERRCRLANLKIANWLRTVHGDNLRF